MARTGKERALSPEEPCGSGQSPESIAKDIAAQPALFAAAARRLTTGAPAETITEPRIGAFDIASSSSAALNDSPAKMNDWLEADTTNTKAICEFIKAKHASGQFSGNIYNKAVPRDGFNIAFKHMMQNIAKVEPKWSPKMQAFLTPMPTVVIAEKVHNGLRGFPGHADDIDEFESEAFDDIEPPKISVFPYQDGLVLHGKTFFFRNELKDMGFVWERDFDNHAGFHVWVGNRLVKEANETALVSLFWRAGFEVNFFDDDYLA